MNSQVIIGFMEHYYSLPIIFKWGIPLTLNDFNNSILWYENIQHIILNYKYLDENKINYIIKNENLIKDGPDSIIIDENLEIAKTIQLKFRNEDYPFNDSILFKWYYQYRSLNEINIGFIDETLFNEQKILKVLSNKIVKTYMYGKWIKCYIKR